MKKNKTLNIAEIIRKKLVSREPLTPQQEQELACWLDQSEANRIYFKNYSLEKEQADFGQVTALSDPQQHWVGLEQRLDGAGRRRMIPRWLGYAAGVALLAGFSAMLLWERDAKQALPAVELTSRLIGPVSNQARLILANGESLDIAGDVREIREPGAVIRIDGGNMVYSPSADEAAVEESAYNILQVPRQGIFSMEMDDGSRIFLNPDSELRYPVNFDGSCREVFLSGEAQFDVAHDPERPFIVHVGDKKITVLGTCFIISAYADEPYCTASLLSGSVSVQHADGTAGQILTPGKRAVWQEGTADIRVAAFTTGHLSLFREGTVILEEENLPHIMRMLSRWYDVTVVYQGDPTVKHSITGQFSRHDDLQEILRLITRLGGPGFRIEQDTVYVY